MTTILRAAMAGAITLVVPLVATAQVDYNGIRSSRTFIQEMTGGEIPFTWIDYSVEDTFLQETRHYALGWGADDALFMLASCDTVAIVFGDDLLFANGTVDAIWDDGPIETYSTEDLDRSLVINDAAWMERMRNSDEVRIRVRGVGGIANDAFDLTTSRVTTRLSPSGEAEDIGHLRELFSVIGCE